MFSTEWSQCLLIGRAGDLNICRTHLPLVSRCSSAKTILSQFESAYGPRFPLISKIYLVGLGNSHPPRTTARPKNKSCGVGMPFGKGDNKLPLILTQLSSVSQKFMGYDFSYIAFVMIEFTDGYTYGGDWDYRHTRFMDKQLFIGVKYIFLDEFQDATLRSKCGVIAG